MRLVYNFRPEGKTIGSYLCVSEIIDIHREEDGRVYFTDASEDDYVSLLPVSESSYEQVVSEISRSGYSRFHSDIFVYDEEDDSDDEDDSGSDDGVQW